MRNAQADQEFFAHWEHAVEFLLFADAAGPTLTVEPCEFMRRFLLLVLPGGFHRIRHYGLRANGSRMSRLALARGLLCQPAVAATPADRGDLILCNAAFDV